eukprot:COSAG03_NODE_35484_length_117_cov_5301.000000_1_plen_22_part_10
MTGEVQVLVGPPNTHTQTHRHT